MESMQELIPFAREMLSQRPGRALLKVYLLGSVFAVLGTIIGLAETVCRPLYSFYLYLPISFFLSIYLPPFIGKQNFTVLSKRISH
uniref:Uncharacterized protein n=1 Tax=Scophthalmus maximus TaxID=52904 RepID=A0A8D2ZNS2_SCOMX